MRSVSLLVTLAALLLLAGCVSPGDVARERCRSVGAPGSAGYQSCWQREYARQMNELNDLAEQRRREELRAGY